MSSSEIVFRCAFCGRDGWGHVTRCSALAYAFREKGWRTLLWTQSDATTLPKEVASAFDEAVSDLRPKSASGGRIALCIDEMYTSDEELASVAKRWKAANPAGVALGIDDMQQRRMYAFDLVINTEIGLRSANYAPPRQLLGERYALLRSGFRESAQPAEWALDSGQQAVFIMIGGTDPFGYAAKTLEALSLVDPDRLAPVVLLGSMKPDTALRSALNTFRSSRVLQRLDSRQVAAWMRRCSFGIIGCGTTPYEAAAMQLPFVGLCLVDNQRATAKKIEASWGLPIIYRENCHDAPLDLSEAIAVLFRRIERTFYAEVDGGGSRRIVDAVEAILAEAKQ